jgi:hypothetical protein
VSSTAIRIVTKVLERDMSMFEAEVEEESLAV